MKMFALLVLALPTLSFATASDQVWPIDPAHAADQEVITSLSMQEEFEQFKALSQWQTAVDQYAVTSLKFEQAKRDYNRAKALRDSGTITKSKFAEAFYARRVQEVDMIRLPQDIVKAKITAQFHKLRVLEEGNPGCDRDHRADIAMALVDGIGLEVQTLNTSAALARDGQSLAQSFWDDGKALARTKEISQVELERRELTAHAADIQVQAIEKQIAVAKLAIASFQTSHVKITSKPPVCK